MILAEERSAGQTLWRLTRTRPTHQHHWPAGTPCPIVELASTPDALHHPLPADLHPVAHGNLRLTPFAAAPLTVELLEGTLDDDLAVCRVTLRGPAADVAPLALDLAGDFALRVSQLSLFDVAIRQTAARHLGAPVLPAGLSVGAACAYVTAHLADVIHHYAPLAAAGEGTEPVHQMRVAMRRLRSGLAVFRRAVACPELDMVQSGLKALGRALGPARDWDVFATGTCHLVAAALPDAPEIAELVRLTGARREKCYDALREALENSEFRRLGIALAVFAAARPWEQHIQDNRQSQALAGDLRDYARHVLHRRLARLREAGDDLTGLPDPALHAVRLHAKRLRYACEIFAPLYPPHAVRHFLRRITVLQDRLGHLNDGSVASELMAQLTPSCGHGFAGGAVRGFVAGRAGDARARIAESWRRFRRLEPFWV